MDHQLPELPLLTTRMKRAVVGGNRIRVTVLPGPVAIGSLQLVPSSETVDLVLADEVTGTSRWCPARAG